MAEDWELKQKFAQLYQSERYIKSLSTYIVSLSKHSSEIVKLWYNQLLKAKLDRKLYFIYVANEVIQQENSPEFSAEFGKVLCEAFFHVSHIAKSKETDKRLKEVIDVFTKKKNFSAELLQEFKQSMSEKRKQSMSEKRKQSMSEKRKQSMSKKRSRAQSEEEHGDKENVNIKKRKHAEKEGISDSNAGDALEKLMRKLGGKEDRTLGDLKKLFQDKLNSIKYC